MAIVNLQRKLPTPFGQYVRKLRIDKDEIMAVMARKLKVSTAYLSAVELGKNDPTPNLVSLISVVYGLNTHETAKLHGLALMSCRKITLSLEGLDDDVKQLAINFARNFHRLSAEKKKVLKGLLEGK